MKFKLATIYSVATLLASSFMGCSNFDDINTNPDSSTKVKSSLLATGAIAGIVKSNYGAGFTDHLFISKYLAWGEGSRGSQYNDFGKEGFGGYVSLKDYELMAELAPEDQKEAYEGLALLLKAYRLYGYTLNVGDIPYKEIMQGEEGVLTPKYDTQKDVFLFLLEDLETASQKFQSARDFDGDIIFNGNVKNWSKITTALQLRVLIDLSMKESDSELNIAQRFKTVFASGSLMESNEDNLQLKYSDKANQFYPFHNSQNRHWSYPMLSDFMVEMLKENQDYRLFYYGSPAKSKLDEGIEANKWEAFVGVDPTEPISDIKYLYATGAYSGLNKRYVDYAPGEPFIRMGYAEQNFILAEAALRNWIDAEPSVYYKKGIEASCTFLATYTPDDKIYNYGNLMTSEVINELLNRSTLQLTGVFDVDLEKIMKQKYLAGFMQLPYQTYYDYRRTGYPKFPINEKTSLNFNAPNKIPVRWRYPDTENQYNKENVEEAIKRQYNGVDEVNKLMWILNK